MRNNDGFDFDSAAFVGYNPTPLPLSQAAASYPDMDISLPQSEGTIDQSSLRFVTDNQSYPSSAISTDSTTCSSLPLPTLPTSQSSFQTMLNTSQSYLPSSLDPLLSSHQSGYSIPSVHDFVPNESFDVNDTPNSNSWGNQFSPTMVVDDHIPAMTPLYPSLYVRPQIIGPAKRPLSNSSSEFPTPKRQLLADSHNSGHYVPVDIDSVTLDSIWTMDKQLGSSQSSQQSEGLPATPVFPEPRRTFSASQQEIGLDEDAADVCATWFSKRYSILPSDQDIEALSHLTKASTTAIRHWFGQMLKQGLAGHDSAYKSQSTLAGSQMSLEQQETLNEITEEVAQNATEENTGEQRACELHQLSEAQARRLSGKKSCTPTTIPEMLQRDESKIFQCTRKCGKRYGRKCDWKRNEEEGYPSKHWFCSLCRSRGERAKPCYRRYHFTQHFNNIHPTLSAADYEAASLVETEATFPRKCGFCPKRFVNRQERIDHIADHFKKGKCMLDWVDSDESDDFNDDNDDSPGGGGNGGSDSRSSDDKQNPDNNPDSEGWDNNEGNNQGDQSLDGSSDSANSPANASWRTVFLQGSLDNGQASETQGKDESIQSIRSQSPDSCIYQSLGEPFTSPPATSFSCSQGKQLPGVFTDPLLNLHNKFNQWHPDKRPDPSFSLNHLVFEHADSPRRTDLKYCAEDFRLRQLHQLPAPRELGGLFQRELHQSQREPWHSGTKRSLPSFSYLYESLICEISQVLENPSSPSSGIRKDIHILHTNNHHNDSPQDTVILRKSYASEHFTFKYHPKSAGNFDKTLNTKGISFSRLLTLLNLGIMGLLSQSSDTNGPHEPDSRPVPPVSQHNDTQPDNPSTWSKNSAANRRQNEKAREIWSFGCILSMIAAWSTHGSVASDQQFDHLLGIDPRKRRKYSKNWEREPEIVVDSEESACKVSMPAFQIAREIFGLGFSLGEAFGGVPSTSVDFGHQFCQGGQHHEISKGNLQKAHFKAEQADGAQANSIDSFWTRSSLASLRLLGTGGFSLVDEVLLRGTNLKICRKTLKKRDSSAFGDLIQEVGVLQQLRHPHIIRFLGTYSRGDSLAILLSPVADVTLSVWLDKYAVGIPLYGQDDMTKMFGCLASSIRYLHEKRPLIKHMDIKPQNILVMEGKYQFPHLVLSDFGISEISKENLSDAGSGPLTRRYCAPEVASSVSRGPEADVWSLGCVFLEMASAILQTANLGYRELQNEFREIKCYYHDIPRVYRWIDCLQGRQTNAGNGCTLETVKSMLNPNPVRRPDAGTISAIFTPGPCCVAWPTDIKSFPGPLEEISSLADVLLEKHDMGLQRELDFMGDTDLHQHHDCLQSAIHWFQSCSTQHLACNSISKHLQILPTRLLDIQEAGLDESPGRLISTTELPSSVDYVTLSYVWGNADQLILTTSNVHNMLHSLPKERLPQAVIDAISVTRRLGVRYLWVDSLCVIQDSQEDRQKECGWMAEVYRNAVLTIVVDAADDSSDPTTTPSDERLTIDWLSPGFAWDTRAWVLQERLLSKRVLHLTDKQMYWECNELKASETFPRGLPPLLWESIHCHSKQPLLQERDPTGLI